MAGGSVRKEKPTDQQCSNCSLWWDSRGIERHEDGCDGSRPDDPAGEVEVFDPHTEQDVDDDAEPEIMTVTCPSCDSEDDVVQPLTYAKVLNRAGELTDRMRDQLEQHDYVCADCEVVFDE